jgi:hypothetical protein
MFFGSAKVTAAGGGASLRMRPDFGAAHSFRTRLADLAARVL